MYFFIPELSYMLNRLQCGRPFNTDLNLDIERLRPNSDLVFVFVHTKKWNTMGYLGHQGNLGSRVPLRIIGVLVVGTLHYTTSTGVHVLRPDRLLCSTRFRTFVRTFDVSGDLDLWLRHPVSS